MNSFGPHIFGISKKSTLKHNCYYYQHHHHYCYYCFYSVPTAFWKMSRSLLAGRDIVDTRSRESNVFWTSRFPGHPHPGYDYDEQTYDDPSIRLGILLEIFYRSQMCMRL